MTPDKDPQIIGPVPFDAAVELQRMIAERSFNAALARNEMPAPPTPIVEEPDPALRFLINVPPPAPPATMGRRTTWCPPPGAFRRRR